MLNCVIACGPTRACSAKNDRRGLYAGRRRPRDYPGYAGRSRDCAKLCARAAKEGIYVTGFFYPVVPKAARIRTQMSAAHTPEQIERAVEAFTRIGKQLGVIA